MTDEKEVGIFRKKSAEFLNDGDVVKAQIRSTDGEIDLGGQENRILGFGEVD